jgi:hypothetical protein
LVLNERYGTNSPSCCRASTRRSLQWEYMSFGNRLICRMPSCWRSAPVSRFNHRDGRPDHFDDPTRSWPRIQPGSRWPSRPWRCEGRRQDYFDESRPCLISTRDDVTSG